MATRVFDKNELILATLRKVDLFSKWPAGVVSEMAQGAQLWRYAKGETLFEALAHVAGVFVLVDGSLLNGRNSATGRQMATSIIRPGWLCCSVPAWDGVECPYTGTARSDLQAILVPSSVFRATIQGDPRRLGDMVTFLATQIRQDTEGLHARAIGSLRCLTAKYLAYLARPSVHLSFEEPDAVDPTAFDVTQDELAAMLHISRQTVNRLMKALEREGVLKREGSRLRIVDFLKLLAVMEEDEPVHHTWRAQIIAWHEKLRATAGKTARAPATAPLENQS